MKKIISAVLLMVMAVSLAACAPEDKKTAGETTVSSACSHSYTDSVTKEAACAEDGEKTFVCGNCGHSYTETIPAVGHQGETGKCTVCGEKSEYYKELTDGPWVHHVFAEAETEGESDSVGEYYLDFQNERFCFGFYEDAAAYPQLEPDLTFLDRQWVNIPLGAPWADFDSVTESDDTITIQMTCMENATMVLERIAPNKLKVTSIQGQTIPDAEGIITVGTIFNFRD